MAMEKFCRDHGIEFEICGKVIVAVDDAELPALNTIFERGQENGVRCQFIDADELKQLEPHVAGIKAIAVPETGIVDYRAVSNKLAELIMQKNSELLLGNSVRKILRAKFGALNTIETTEHAIETRLIVNCAGLHCDRVSKLGGLKSPARIVPFRGEYFQLVADRQHLCNNLIYPVPDPKYPFLGVHFTRMIDGTVECGPNAVLAFAREGYKKTNINFRDLAESLTYPGFARMALKHWKMGAGEIRRSFSKAAFVKALQRLVPEIQAVDLKPAPAGVRAQAVLRDGNMLDDFLIEQDESMISVLNAPSPAATASLNIGRLIAERVSNRLS